MDDAAVVCQKKYTWIPARLLDLSFVFRGSTDSPCFVPLFLWRFVAFCCYIVEGVRPRGRSTFSLSLARRGFVAWHGVRGGSRRAPDEGTTRRWCWSGCNCCIAVWNSCGGGSGRWARGFDGSVSDGPTSVRQLRWPFSSVLLTAFS